MNIFPNVRGTEQIKREGENLLKYIQKEFFITIQLNICQLGAGDNCIIVIAYV